MNVRPGIVGGGQLGLYLCEAAQAPGVKVAIISDSVAAAALRERLCSYKQRLGDKVMEKSLAVRGELSR